MSLLLALTFSPAFAQDVPTRPVPVEAPVEVDDPAELEAPVDTEEPVVLEEPVEDEAAAESGAHRAARMLADQRVEVKGGANDLFVLAQDARLRAPVDDNAFVLAQDVSIDAPMNGDVYTMGESVEIDAPVDGDVYAMGGRVEILEGGAVAGNVIVAGGEVVLRAPIAGDVSVQSGHLEIAAPIAGDVSLEVGEVVVGEDASIGGSLDYSSPQPNAELERRVSGDVTHTVKEVEAEEFDTAVEDLAVEEEESSTFADIVWWGGMRGWGFLTKLLVGFVLLVVGGQRMGSVGRQIAANPGKSLGIGFIAACVLPMASFVAIATVVPFPLGLLGFATFGILAYVGQIFAAQAVGDFLLKRFQPDAIGSPYLSLAIGLVPLIAVCTLPWLGNIAWLAFTCAGIGGLWSVLRGADPSASLT